MSYNVRLFDLYNWNENEKSKSEIFKLIQEVKTLIFYAFKNITSQMMKTYHLKLEI